jgi:hypothetical protein
MAARRKKARCRAKADKRLGIDELARFANTDKCLEGRQAVYKHPPVGVTRDQMIAIIKKAIANGDASQKAIIKLAREDLNVLPEPVMDFLKATQGTLWHYKNGTKSARIFNLPI